MLKISLLYFHFYLITMHSSGILWKQKKIMKCQINLDTNTLLRNKSLMGDEFKFNIYIFSVPDSLKGPHETCISKLVS